MMPPCSHTGTPSMEFEGFLHFTSSTTSGSACLISARTRASVSPRQSPSFLIRASISREGESPASTFGTPLFFMPVVAFFNVGSAVSGRELKRISCNRDVAAWTKLADFRVAAAKICQHALIYLDALQWRGVGGILFEWPIEGDGANLVQIRSRAVSVLLCLEFVHEVVVVLLKLVAVPDLLAVVRDPQRQDRVLVFHPGVCHRVTHMRTPGNWLACLIQSTSWASSIGSFSWMSR